MEAVAPMYAPCLSSVVVQDVSRYNALSWLNAQTLERVPTPHVSLVRRYAHGALPMVHFARPRYISCYATYFALHYAFILYSPLGFRY